MDQCLHFQECEFVLRYVAQVQPHWDDFVSHYCHGDFQDVCARRKWFETHGTKPAAVLMPTGSRVPGMMDEA